MLDWVLNMVIDQQRRVKYYFQKGPLSDPANNCEQLSTGNKSTV